MRPLSPRSSGRVALASLLSLCLAACGDDLSPRGGDDDDDDDGSDGSDGGDGISIEGLDGPVDVYFDGLGILHASCQTDADCFAVEGYFHAAHRFGQMDLRRRVARGRLSALIGTAGLATDRAQRVMMTARDGTPLEEQLMASADERTVEALEAYSRGVNAWLADLAAGRNGAALPAEYSFPLIAQDAIQDDWEPLDSVACVLPLVDSLTNHSGIDLLAGEVYAALPPEVAEDLFPIAPPSPSTVLPPPIGPTAQRQASQSGELLHQRMAASGALFREALRRMPPPSFDHDSIGSNNWIVGPSKTKTGGALLANDPHLSLSHPAIWYLVHLDAKTNGTGAMHVAGASFAGLPGILLGHNEDIAWGATTTYFDSTDVYVEELNEDGTAVIFNGEEVPIEYHDYTFEVAGGEPVTESFGFVPHHGPILLENPADAADDRTLTVRWTGHDADTDINFFLGLASATSVDDAREAIRDVTTAGQNYIVADREGNIGWFPYNRLPTRPWASATASATTAPPWLPLPGTGAFEWGAPIPYEDLPQAVNPASGFLATANNDMTGALADGDPTNDGYPFIQGYVDEGYRHQRIVERLGERDDHDLASMQSIQADVFSLLGGLLTPRILAAVDGAELDADGQAVAAALADWDFECPTGLAGIDLDAAIDPDTAASARGCAAFHVTWARLRVMVFGDELEELAPGLAQGLVQPAAVIHALTDPVGGLNRVYWDDRTTAVVEDEAAIVAAALGSAGAFLREKLGEPADWMWGRLHTLKLRADLFSGAGIAQFDSEPFANDGGLFTVDVANPRDELGDDFGQSAGPSMRFACQTGEPGVECTIELPGGQRHDKESKFFDSMFDEWLTNQPVAFPFSIEEVAAAAPEETVRVQPR